MRFLVSTLCLMILLFSLGCSADRELPTAVSMNADHPDESTLTKYTDEQLSIAQESDVHDHLAQCGRCSKLVALMAEDDLGSKQRR